MIPTVYFRLGDGYTCSRELRLTDLGICKMARVKIDSRSTSDRLNAVGAYLRTPHRPDLPENYAYEAGYLISALERALEMLPVGKRQEFLSDLERYNQPKTRKVVSLMSGEEVEIASDTPMCCDPSTETYWSM